MRLFDPQSQHWAIRHIYVVMALVGTVMLALIPPVGGYLAIRNQELFEMVSFDEPNSVYLHDGVDATLVTVWLLVTGGGLVVIAVTLALEYWLIGRSVAFELLKLKGSNVD